jgi:hypothetical protein
MHGSTSHHSTALHCTGSCGVIDAKHMEKLGFHWPKAVCVFLHAQAPSCLLDRSQTKLHCCPWSRAASLVTYESRKSSVSKKASKQFTRFSQSTEFHLNSSILLAAPRIRTKLAFRVYFLAICIVVDALFRRNQNCCRCLPPLWQDGIRLFATHYPTPKSDYSVVAEPPALHLNS